MIHEESGESTYSS